ncbi:hypothetical protein K449DRAFT_430707 [Hypoxylon sp. EC38]|nr:hypothetical protein K449DRAFT_430707 [Hypoxylon sp. EC38]
MSSHQRPNIRHDRMHDSRSQHVCSDPETCPQISCRQLRGERLRSDEARCTKCGAYASLATSELCEYHRLKKNAKTRNQRRERTRRTTVPINFQTSEPPTAPQAGTASTANTSLPHPVTFNTTSYASGSTPQSTSYSYGQRNPIPLPRPYVSPYAAPGQLSYYNSSVGSVSQAPAQTLAAASPQFELRPQPTYQTPRPVDWQAQAQPQAQGQYQTQYQAQEQRPTLPSLSSLNLPYSRVTVVLQPPDCPARSSFFIIERW